MFNKWVVVDEKVRGYYSIRLFNDGSGKLVNPSNGDEFTWATFAIGMQKFEQLLSKDVKEKP